MHEGCRLVGYPFRDLPLRRGSLYAELEKMA